MATRDLSSAKLLKHKALHKNKTWLDNIWENRSFILMLLPGIVFLICFCYMPMAGIALAFKNIDYAKGLLGSDWVGLKNFEFFFRTPDAWVITRNTVLYNAVFIVLGPVLAVSSAIALSELKNKVAAKFYQTIMFFPHFLSWVVVGYISFAFFNSSYGLMNRVILEALNIKEIAWFSEAKHWPVIITVLHFWKSLGYSVVVYLAAILGIDSELYEAAAIDGASKMSQIFHITLPSLIPLITMLFILNIGKIFDADFGLFYQTTMNSGALYDTTNVISTYVFRALRTTGDLGMAAATSLYQSVVGFILVVVTNAIVNKIDSDNALF